MSQNIYFDESGFTGNNLLNPIQTVFSYGSVATTDKQAEEFVTYAIKKYGIQSKELKGKDLVKFNKGRKLCLELLKEFDGQIKVALFDKKFALACKFFEYIFEPCIAENNSLFYSLDFHKFISNILHVEFAASAAGAEEIFADFEKLMREKSFDGLNALFSVDHHKKLSPILNDIREFSILMKEQIAEELASLEGTSSEKWILELTGTSLFTLLAEWGEKHDQITAYCDESKPLQHNQSIFNVMINRTERKRLEAFGKSQAITFNLSSPINFANSKLVHGVQIADVAAATFAYAFGMREKNDFTSAIGAYVRTMVSESSVFPDHDFVDLKQLSVQRNALILIELKRRALSKQSLLDGMPQYIRVVSQRLKTNPLGML